MLRVAFEAVFAMRRLSHGIQLLKLMCRLGLVLAFLLGVTPRVGAFEPCSLDGFGSVPCGRAQTDAFSKNFGKYFRASNTVLVITPENGKTRSYPTIDENSADDRSASVVGVLESFPLFIIAHYFGEGGDIELVNYLTGENFVISGQPILSPDKKRLLVFSEAVESNYLPNHLTIYRLVQNRLFEEATLNGDENPEQSWGPVEPKWNNASTITYQKKRFEANGEVLTPVTLILRNDGWYSSEQPSKPLLRADAVTDGVRAN